jgi:hypothetical protein
MFYFWLLTLLRTFAKNAKMYLVNDRSVRIGYLYSCLFIVFMACNTPGGAKVKQQAATKPDSATKKEAEHQALAPARLDTVKYKSLDLHLVHDSVSARWPVKAPYPLPGAILPFKRIVAYYGNFYTAGLGVLGEKPTDSMLKHLMAEVKKWQAADTTMGVMPALHYIAVTAQGKPGKGDMYRMRMPFAQIDKALELAKKIDAIVILDVQVGWSTVQTEIPLLEPYLKMPNVHLAIDPEFSMKSSGRAPGSIIGTYDAADINYVTDYLAKLVKQYNLPPKIFIVHRFTKGMVTNYKEIALHPEVQFIMDMDGWGFPAKKVSSYKIAEVTEPVQYTGFKLFYKNDILTPPWKTIMKPSEVLKLYPSPVYIQYQ